MKRNSRKFTNNDHEREFDEMKKNLSRDGIGTGRSYNRSYSRNENTGSHYRKPSYNKPYNSEREEIGSVAATYPAEATERVDDFVELMKRVVAGIDNSRDLVKLDTEVSKSQMAGRVTATVACRAEDSETYGDGVTFLYVEDYIKNPKAPRPPKAYPASLVCVSNTSKKILFSKVNPKCVDYSEKYVTSIIEKELSYASKQKAAPVVDEQ